MKINIMTLFPELFNDFLTTSIISRAIDKKILEVDLFNIRDYSKFKSRQVDDYVYGGGEGMLMRVEPIYDCYQDIVQNKKIKTIYMSPKGKLLTNDLVKEYSEYSELVILCGHYEGVDERAIELLEAEEVSIGDYVLTGGELPAMVFIDCVSRFVKGVLNNEESNKNDTFSNGLLESPQWTRPNEYMGLKVPDILISGDHKKVSEFKLNESIKLTKNNRPDLYEKWINNKNKN